MRNRQDGKEKTQAEGERISEAEFAVMEALWTESPLTAAQIAERIGEKRGWSLATIKTLLSRLASKEAVATAPDGRRFLYSPRIERSAFVGSESRRLLDRLFAGKASSLFAHLAEAEALDDTDLAEIEALLKDLRK